MTYQDFITRAKNIVNNQPIPPLYNPDDYDSLYFNCYAYALQLCMDCKDWYISPGFMSKQITSRYDIPYTKKYILESFKEDCELLGLQVFSSTILEPIRSDEYKIAIYIIENYGFHFARLDSNGKWSEKPGWLRENKIRIVESVTENKNGYKFIGVFRVSKKVG